MDLSIRGETAAQIVESIRGHLDAGSLGPGDPLPPVREVAQALGVNRNTVVAAYKQLTAAGLAVTNRGAGTSIAPKMTFFEEGFLEGTAVTDVGSGNPARDLLPDIYSQPVPSSPPILYGDSTIDPGLGDWARDWFARDLGRAFEVTVTSGTVDAIERLLAQGLTPADAVAIEDPGYLTSANIIRRARLRVIAVAVDEDGMVPSSLARALGEGARAVICTPRAHNPTGACLTAVRAKHLRRTLEPHPHVLIIEDDHFSMLSSFDHHSIIPETHRRWAVIRSLSKFLGPDLRVALLASDPLTAGGLGDQISAGTNWVSHLLQRTALSIISSDGFPALIDRARAHYRERNGAFVAALGERGVSARARDGLNVWVDTGPHTAQVFADLMRCGWATRMGDSFRVSPEAESGHLRFTVHQVTDAQMAQLADIVSQGTTAGGAGPGA